MIKSKPRDTEQGRTAMKASGEKATSEANIAPRANGAKDASEANTALKTPGDKEASEVDRGMRASGIRREMKAMGGTRRRSSPVPRDGLIEPHNHKTQCLNVSTRLSQTDGVCCLNALVNQLVVVMECVFGIENTSVFSQRLFRS